MKIPVLEGLMQFEQPSQSPSSRLERAIGRHSTRADSENPSHANLSTQVNVSEQARAILAAETKETGIQTDATTKLLTAWDSSNVEPLTPASLNRRINVLDKTNSAGKAAEQMAALDQDGNGWIDENDAAYDKIWVDMPNTNRMVSLREAGIEALALASGDNALKLLGKGEGVDLDVIRNTSPILYTPRYDGVRLWPKRDKES